MIIRVRSAMNAYGASKETFAALKARKTKNEHEMLRIAEHSKDRLVLLNLAKNDSITDSVVETLKARNVDAVNKLLESLGHVR